jgi:hypothetical protein
MNEPSYSVARIVAARIEARLAADTTSFRSSAGAAKPDRAAIEEMISTAFWASLRREEGKGPRISLAFLSPEQSDGALTFDPPLPLEPNVITRLAPAVERRGIHLGIWQFNERLFVWGTTRTLPIWCFVLEVVAPGLLVVKYRRADPLAKFANVAVLEGADVKFIEQEETEIVPKVTVFDKLMAFYASGGRHDSDNALVRLAFSMRTHGHGGTLLIVPEQSDRWRQSIVHPMIWSVTSPDSDVDRDVTDPAIDALAGLTAVDGATIMSTRFELLAFGVKIQSVAAADRVRKVLLKEPIENLRDSVLEASQIGGTRHLSAAQFVYDQRDSIAMVASQDSRFTVFTWSATDQLVLAHRLETLLM